MICITCQIPCLWLDSKPLTFLECVLLFIYLFSDKAFEDDDDDEEEEEVIRCVCNIYRDEGIMICCEKCDTWQHCECMGVSPEVEDYLCELCDPRPVSKVRD